MSEKLCIFCTKFRWRKEEQWGTGSTMTGPMMTGGSATCDSGHNDTQWLYPAAAQALAGHKSAAMTAHYLERVEVEWVEPVRIRV